VKVATNRRRSRRKKEKGKLRNPQLALGIMIADREDFATSFLNFVAREVRAYTPAADASSPDGFAGASTIRVTPMIANVSTPSASPRGIRLRYT